MARSAIIDKTQALEAALLVFWRQGYEATPVIGLAVAMRLNRAGLYKNFGSKYELFLSVLRYYQQVLHGQLLVLSTDANATILTRVRRVLNLTVTLPTVRSLPKGCFLLKAGSELLPQDAGVQAVVNESQRFLEALLVPLLQQGQQTGEVRASASPLVQARFLGNVLNGLHMTSQLHPDPALLSGTIELTLLALAKELEDN